MSVTLALSSYLLESVTSADMKLNECMCLRTIHQRHECPLGSHEFLWFLLLLAHTHGTRQPRPPTLHEAVSRFLGCVQNFGALLKVFVFVNTGPKLDACHTESIA
jgi:hypothetical protein